MHVVSASDGHQSVDSDGNGHVNVTLCRMIKLMVAGASPYNMVAGAGTPGPMMSPAPNQDSMGYNMSLNGGDYSSGQVKKNN